MATDLEKRIARAEGMAEEDRVGERDISGGEIAHRGNRRPVGEVATSGP